MGISHPKRAQKLLKNASTIETLKTRFKPRFANQKMDCSRGKGLENASKMAQKMGQKMTKKMAKKGQKKHGTRLALSPSYIYSELLIWFFMATIRDSNPVAVECGSNFEIRNGRKSALVSVFYTPNYD